MSRSAFDPLRALQMLSYNGVRFVLIGGLAGRSYGSTLITNDLDVCYDRGRENVDRLVATLMDLNARLRGVEDDVPFLLETETILAGDSFTFDTDAGAFDCIATPPGSGGYKQLVKGAEEVSLEGFTVKVASLDDLIAMKRAAGRPKDREAIEVLAALADEIVRAQRDP